MLPPLLMLYFFALNDGHLDGATACFSTEARVEDEGGMHVGTAAIRQWLEDTTQKYKPVFDPKGCEEKDGLQIVTASVSGTFPGSLVELEFAFSIHESKITRLAIG